MSKIDKPRPLIHLTGGGISGMTACIILQPLDLIKTRLQQQRQDHLAFLREAKLKGIKVAPFKSNIYTTIKDIINSNGYSGLWRGTVPTILRNVPGSALYFFALSEIRQILSKTRPPFMTEDNQRWQNLLSGSTARGAVGYVMMPITVVKVRYEVN
ncbi:mitochondrial carrier domain-containing protein [Pilobolus umbonatus]|nr:mitochondrial carrier domain-containing protein [Pilobolus umbonatus]